MDNERQSSLPSSLLPHLYTAPNQPRDSGTRTTIDSDDDQTDTYPISPVQFPFAPPRRIYTQTVQPHPQQQRQQRPFLPYDLDQQPAAGGTRDAGHQHQIMYNDSLLPSSTRPIMPVSRPPSSYSYPPLEPPASRQQLASGTSTATRTSWNEGEPGPSSLLHHQQQQDSRAARHRRDESSSPRVLPHIDPFSRRAANYEHDPASFGHVVRRDAEKDLYFSSFPGAPTTPQHHQHLQHQQNHQHPQHQTVSNYFAQQPQPHNHSQNYSNNQQQHLQHEHYQYREQHQQRALSTSQSLSESRSQQHFFLPGHDDDTTNFPFASEPQSYSDGYHDLPPSTPSPQFPSGSSSGGEMQVSSYTYHRSATDPNEITRAEHRLGNHPGHTIDLLRRLTHPTRHSDPNYERFEHADGVLYNVERADRSTSRPHPKPWYLPTSTHNSTDLRHGPLFSVASARARAEDLSRLDQMDVDERTRDRESDLNKDRDKDWEMHWNANPGGGTAVAQSPGLAVAPGESHAEGGTGGVVSASASSGGGRSKRGKGKASADKRRRADELARQNKGAAVQAGYRHDQKVWQREEAQAKRPKKTLVACDFCRGRKLRCDGTRPSCAHCVARGLICIYAKFARRRGPGKAPRGARAKKNAEARAIAESSVVFKNGVDPAAFKAKPPEKAEGGATRGGRRKGGAAASTSTSEPAHWPASLAGMRGEGGMVPEGAGLSMGGAPVGTRLPGHSGPNNVANEHDYELEMLAPEVRPYASVMALDTIGPVPSSHQTQPPPHHAPAPTLRGYGGAEPFYNTADPGLAPRMGAPDRSGAAGGTAAGNVGSGLGGSGIGSMRRSGGAVGVGTSSSLSITTGGGPGSMSVSGAGYGFEGPSPAPHYPPAPPPDLRYDTTEQARVFRDNGLSSSAGMQGMSMGMDMMDTETISGNGGPGSASGYSHSREETVTRKRSTTSLSETERNE